MPKSKRKQQLSPKQKKLITARLMQISMKIDDYLFNNKPITEDEAKLYAKEVEACRPSCLNDERSLQVIEKLASYMKTIIAEHQASKDTHEHTGSVSPVYSTCDDDLTQFTETETPVNVVDLTEDEEINENEETNIFCRRNVDAEIHKASKQISHLSLEENDFIQTASTDADLPRILENLNTKHPDVHIQDVTHNIAFFNNPLKVTKIPYNKINNKTIDSNTTSKSINNEAVNLIKDTETSQQSIPADISKQTNFSTNSSSIVNIHSHNINTNDKCKSTNIDCSQSILINYDDDNNLNKKSDIPKAPIDKLRNFNKQNTVLLDNSPKVINSTSPKSAFIGGVKLVQKTKEKTNKKILEFCKRRETNPLHVSKPKKKQNKQVSNSTKKPQASRKQKIQVRDKTKLPFATSNTYSQTTNIVNNTGNKKAQIPPIYKDSTENDLSWLEGIRYVREVRQDEYIKLDLQETFWDNFCLPPDWNVSEYF